MGCWEMLPASKDPIRDAEHHERATCTDATPSYPANLFSPGSVISVDPLYFIRSEHGNQAQHLSGVTIALRPFPGVTSQDLERFLTCHAARSQLGRAGEPMIPNDPYWAPGHPVRITVEFEEGALRVQIEGTDFEGAKAILKRATAFVPPSAG
jgi:hypothetical protein